MAKQLSVFLLGLLVGSVAAGVAGVVGAVLTVAALRRTEWDEDDEELDDEAQEPPPLRHSVVDPRLDQRLPTMAIPPEPP